MKALLSALAGIILAFAVDAHAADHTVCYVSLDRAFTHIQTFATHAQIPADGIRLEGWSFSLNYEDMAYVGGTPQYTRSVAIFSPDKNLTNAQILARSVEPIYPDFEMFWGVNGQHPMYHVSINCVQN
jgi:hypothetical protein